MANDPEESALWRVAKKMSRVRAVPRGTRINLPATPVALLRSLGRCVPRGLLLNRYTNRSF